MVTDLLNPALMIMDLKAQTAQEAVTELCQLAAQQKIVSSAEILAKKIWQRERQISTGIGHGIAMPHAQSRIIYSSCVIFAKSKAGIDFAAIDQKPVHLFFMLLAPAKTDAEHLHLLAQLSQLLLNKDLLAALNQVETPREVCQLFARAEAGKPILAIPKSKQAPLIVAVTACLNGIAHTYMAEAALQQAGKKKGWQVRVETNGSEGVRHQLTAAEIKAAQGVIVAADKQVAMKRFAGKKLLSTSTVAAIIKPDQVLAHLHTAPIYRPSQADQAAPAKTKTDFSKIKLAWHALMAGVAHLLPFAVASGIFLALARICKNYQLLAAADFLQLVSHLTSNLMIPILAAFTGAALAGQPALLLGFVGGSLCTISVFSKCPAGILGGACAGLLAAMIVDGLQKVFGSLPTAVHGLKPMLIYPVFGLLLESFLIYFAIDPAFGWLNYWLLHWLSHLPTWALMIVTTSLSMMMAADLGGPLNKAAYLLAVAVFVNEPSLPVAAVLMAAVMVGGMVPPLATALAGLFLKSKLSLSLQRESRLNWLRGASFITEGAIPFAKKNRQATITASLIGAALGGLLIGCWRVGVPAPHGGLWLTILASNWQGYLVSVFSGMIVAALVLIFNWGKTTNKEK